MQLEKKQVQAAVPRQPLVFQVKLGEAEASSKKQVVVPSRVGDTTKTETQDKMVWLIGDRHNTRRQQLTKAGWKVDFCRNGNISDEQRQNWRTRLNTDKPCLLYIVECGGMGTNHEVSSFLANLIGDQLKLCGLI